MWVGSRQLASHSHAGRRVAQSMMRKKVRPVTPNTKVRPVTDVTREGQMSVLAWMRQVAGSAVCEQCSVVVYIASS